MRIQPKAPPPLIVATMILQLGGGSLWADSDPIPTPPPASVFEIVSPNPVNDGQFGFAISAVPDADGDHADDFLVNARNEARTYLFSGATREILLQINDTGSSVLGVSDVTGDGRGDILVSNQARTQVRLLSGATGAVQRSVNPPGTNDFSFGVVLCSIPDVTGDGLADVVMTKATNVSGAEVANSVYIYSMPNLSLVKVWKEDFAADYYLGQSAVGLPDLDSDGKGDLLAGARYGLQTGAQIISGGGPAVVSGNYAPTSQARIAAFPGDGGMGFSVAMMPRSAGDPPFRLAIGDNLAQTILLSDLLTSQTLTAPDTMPGDRFGRVAGVPDFNGDGEGDLLVGAPLADAGLTTDSGRVYLFDGATMEPLFKIESPHPVVLGRLGHGLAAVGDLNHDGRSDLAVGAISENAGATGSGRVYVIKSEGVEVTPVPTILPTPPPGSVVELVSPNPVANGRFGYAVAAVPDANGDYADDFAVSAYGENRVYLFSGATGEVLWSIANQGGILAGLPDATGDGRGDVLVPRDGNYVVELYDGATAALAETFGTSVFFPQIRALSSVPDLTGDGKNDIIMTVLEFNIYEQSGAVRLIDGVTFAAIYNWLEVANSDLYHFGYAAIGVPDMNGDHLGDILIGSKYGAQTGARLLSGIGPGITDDNFFKRIPSDGAALASFPGNSGFGQSVAMLPRSTGDPAFRLAIGDPVAQSATLTDLAHSTTFKAADMEESDGFATSIVGARDHDGDGEGDLLVSAPNRNRNQIADVGRVYLYDGATSQTLYVMDSPNPVAGGKFGFSIAAAEDLNYDQRGDLIIGAPYETANALSAAGRVYVIKSQGEVITPTPSLTPSPSFTPSPTPSPSVSPSISPTPTISPSPTVSLTPTATPTFLPDPSPGIDGRFGYSVSTDGELAVVGAPYQWAGGIRTSGAAYVYDTTSGALLTVLNNPAAQAHDLFGRSVGLSGGLVIVGADQADPGELTEAGLAHIFDAATGDLVVTLAHPEPEASDQFGIEVAISGELAAVAADSDDPDGVSNAGAVFVFAADTGDLVSSLANPQPDAFDRFGSDVAISGNLVVVGAEQEDPESVIDAGTAYVFDATTGALLATLNNPSPTANDRFGESVAISGNLVIVGAGEADASGLTDAGAAFVFEATSGDLLASLLDPDPTALDSFGKSVALSGGRALVGANEKTVLGIQSGRVFAFDALSGALEATFDNPAPDNIDNFGFAVALSGNRAVVGAPYDDPGGVNDAGSAYAFLVPASSTPSPTATITPSATPSETPQTTESPTETPTASASPTPSPTPCGVALAEGNSAPAIGTIGGGGTFALTQSDDGSFHQILEAVSGGTWRAQIDYQFQVATPGTTQTFLVSGWTNESSEFGLDGWDFSYSTNGAAGPFTSMGTLIPVGQNVDGVTAEFVFQELISGPVTIRITDTNTTESTLSNRQSVLLIDFMAILSEAPCLTPAPSATPTASPTPSISPTRTVTPTATACVSNPAAATAYPTPVPPDPVTETLERPASGVTRTVAAAGGPGGSIQEVINASSSGDRIVLLGSLYTESVVISGKDNLVIEAQSGVTEWRSSTTSQFVCTVLGQPKYGAVPGHVITLTNSANLTLINLKVVGGNGVSGSFPPDSHGCPGTAGASAVYGSGSSLIAVGSEFRGGRGGNSGGWDYCADRPTLGGGGGAPAINLTGTIHAHPDAAFHGGVGGDGYYACWCGSSYPFGTPQGSPGSTAPPISQATLNWVNVAAPAMTASPTPTVSPTRTPTWTPTVSPSPTSSCQSPGEPGETVSAPPDVEPTVAFTPSAGSTWIVPQGGSIQAAINAAADGDRIVLTGTYYTEKVTISGRHGLLIEASRALTWIGGYGALVPNQCFQIPYQPAVAPLILLNSSNIILSGFSLQGANGMAWSYTYDFACAGLPGSDALVATNSTIFLNEMSLVGGAGGAGMRSYCSGLPIGNTSGRGGDGGRALFAATDSAVSASPGTTFRSGSGGSSSGGAGPSGCCPYPGAGGSSPAPISGPLSWVNIDLPTLPTPTVSMTPTPIEPTISPSPTATPSLTMSPTSSLSPTPSSTPISTPPAAAAGDQYGYSVAIDGQWSVVGAPFVDDSGTTDTGAAYVLDAVTGSPWVTLSAPAPAASDEFGSSVAVSGALAVVGVPGADPGGVSNAGSAHLFNAATGEFLMTLVSPAPVAGRRFGRSVGISGNLVVIGGSAAAYVYDATTGALVSTLANPAPTTFDHFAYSVAISGDLAIVGADGANPGGISDAGSAYVFDASSGALVATLGHPSPVASMHFGGAVAISGNIAVVGGTHVNYAGTACAFNATTGELLAELISPRSRQYDLYGYSVAVSGNTALVGQDVNLTFGGPWAVYAFNASTGELTASLLNASSSSGYNSFGFSCAISGSQVLVGAPKQDSPGLTNHGAVFGFMVVTPEPTPVGTPTPSQTPSPTQTITATPTASVSPSAVVTDGNGLPTATPTQTPTISPSPTVSPTEDYTITPSVTETPDLTPTETPDATPTEIPEVTPTETPDATPTETPEVTPTDTPTPEITPTVTPSPTSSPTPEVTLTPSVTETATPSPSPTATIIPSPSPTPSPTPPLMGDLIRAFLLGGGAPSPQQDINGDGVIDIADLIAAGSP